MRAVLFDHDGTLVDSEPTHHRLWNEVLAAYGVRIPDDLYRTLYAGLPTRANAEDVARRFGLAESPERLMQAKLAATRAYLARAAFPLMPGAARALRDLQGFGLRLAVVTGANPDGVQATLRFHGLGPLIEVIVTGDDVPRSKPAPDCYLLALERLGLEAGECVAVEDTEYGLRSAHLAGVPCLAVPTDMSRNHDFSKALAVLENLTAVADRLRERPAIGGTPT
jgi:HAD superfamily hydrolase (TIGR01509 family)